MYSPFLVEVAELVELGQGAVDGGGAGLVLDVEAALAEPDVKVAAGLVAGLADGLQHHLVAALAEVGHALVLGGIDPLEAVELVEADGQVDDVVAAVGVAAQVGV